MSAVEEYRKANRIADEVLSETYATTLTTASTSRELADAAIAECLEEIERLEAEVRKWKARRMSAEQKLGYEEKLRERAEGELAALKAIAIDMEQFIDSCTYHMRDGEPVNYKGERP